MQNILVNAGGWNECSTSPIACLLYLLCTFHFPACCHSSRGLLSPQAHLGKKNECHSWWGSDWMKQMAQWQKSNADHAVTAEDPINLWWHAQQSCWGTKEEGWHVGAEVGVKVWVLCQPIIPSLLAHAQSEELWKRLHVCGNISWRYGWCTVCLPLSLLQLFKGFVGAQMVKSSDKLYFDICALVCLC